MSLTTYLSFNKITDYEGNSGQIPQQTNTLAHLCNDLSIRSIIEIGFNAGHSADTFLSRSLAHVTSFDLQERECVTLAKGFIDQKYPTRHTLIVGDSTKTIPLYLKDHPKKKFDLIYIDGGHTEEVAYADLINCKELAHNKTVVIMDDVVLKIDQQRDWSIGPSKVWAEAILNGVIHDVYNEFYGPGRGMGWGYYSM
jgi:predicted O-methyltransferase YrrM